MLAILLAVEGSGGQRLLFRYPPSQMETVNSKPASLANEGGLSTNMTSREKQPQKPNETRGSIGTIGALSNNETTVIGSNTVESRPDRLGGVAGYSSFLLADMLTPRSLLYDSDFVLIVDDHLFAGHPATMPLRKTVAPQADDRIENVGLSQVPSRSSIHSRHASVDSVVSSDSINSRRPLVATGRMFHFVFMLPAHVSQAQPKFVQAITTLAGRVTSALCHEELRCGYLSEQETILASLLDNSKKSGDALIVEMVNESSLARFIKTLFLVLADVQQHQVADMTIQLNKWIDIDIGVEIFAQPPNSVSLHGRQAPVTTPYETVHTIRPYHTLLLLMDARQLVKLLPTDCSKQLHLLVEEVSQGPTRSFQNISLDTGIALSQLYRLSMHLVSWKCARITHTVSQSAIYTVHPNSSLGVVKSNQFKTHFRSLDLATVLDRFADPFPLGDHLQSKSQQEQSQFMLAVYWLLQNGLLIELHTHIFLMIPTATSSIKQRDMSTGSFASRDSDNLEPDHDLTLEEYDFLKRHPATVEDREQFLLLLKLSSYLRGHHHITEMMWRENLAREQLKKLMSDYNDVLIACVHEELVN